MIGGDFINYDHLNEVYDDYLEHYGILGMKWGVRRTPEQLGHTTPTKEERKNTRTLKRRTAAAIKNLKEKGESYKAAEDNLLTAKENYQKASKKMYLFKKNRLSAIKEASEQLTKAFEMAEGPRAEMDRARKIYNEAADKMWKDNQALLKKYGSDTISAVKEKNIEYGITMKKSGFFSDEYTAFVDKVLDPGLTVVNIPWYGQRYTGKFVSEQENAMRDKEFDKQAKKRY